MLIVNTSNPLQWTEEETQALEGALRKREHADFVKCQIKYHAKGILEYLDKTLLDMSVEDVTTLRELLSRFA